MLTLAILRPFHAFVELGLSLLISQAIKVFDVLIYDNDCLTNEVI